MAKIGYARVSTEEQELTAQLEQLQAAGVDKLFKECHHR
jgi:DNA invertase Pin-like site-specific DNA recombinase